MLRKHFEIKNNDEYGFTLIELLVVILIIGILAAIAIPAFLNQRQRANDSAVQSDVRNVAMAIEAELVASPNGTVRSTGAANSPATGTVIAGVTTSAGTTVNLTSGVSIHIRAVGTGTGVYRVYGIHSNGKSFRGPSATPGSFPTDIPTTAAAATTNGVLMYDSNAGGLVN